MSTIAIRAEGLGKRYRLGQFESYKTLRDLLVNAAKAPLRRGRAGNGRPQGPDHIWALKDASFKIHQGEVVGIIGRNGAGKSTLLKILSQITEPTVGSAEIHGRVSSLLEVGTGFHVELTGRENIYLNGAILGMSQTEINRKFDEIVAFSEVEAFLDTPVKRYSSGMRVRLAFAVAAHLEPEVMIVDEVLAVGDVAFQKKCLGKMGEVSQAGRTVLIVSHNMTAIRSLCTRAIVLRQGRQVFDGDVEQAVDNYLTYLTESASQSLENNPERSGSGVIRLTGARLLDEKGAAVSTPISGKPLTIELDYENPGRVNRLRVVMTLFNQKGVPVTNFDTDISGVEFTELGEAGKLLCMLPRLPLPPGQYRIAVALKARRENADLIPNAVVFEVQVSDFFPTARTPKPCVCLVDHDWTLQPG